MKYFFIFILLSLFLPINANDKIQIYDTIREAAGVQIDLIEFIKYNKEKEKIKIEQIFPTDKNPDTLSTFPNDYHLSDSKSELENRPFNIFIGTFPGNYRFLIKIINKNTNKIIDKGYVNVEIYAEYPQVHIYNTGFVMVDWFGKYDNNHKFSKDIFPSIFKKMLDNNANWISVISLANYIKFFPTPIIKEGTKEVNLSKNDLKEFVDKAHYNNIKVIWQHQLAPRPVLEKAYETILFNMYNAYLPLTFWKSWFKEYEKYIIEQAKTAEELKIDVFQFFYGDFQTAFANDNIKKFYVNSWLSLIKRIRKEYSGKLAICPYAKVFNNYYETTRYLNKLVEKIDILMLDISTLGGGFPIGGNINFKNPQNPKMSELINAYQQFFSWIYWYFNGFEEFRGDVFVVNNIASCTEQDNFVFIDHKTTHYNTNYIEQQKYYEAFFGFIGSLPYITGVFSGNYDWFDTIDYKIDHFDNFESQSVRNKPAEKIVKMWFKIFMNAEDLDEDN